MERKESGKKSSALNNHNEMKVLINKLLQISAVPQEKDVSKLLENHKDMTVIIETIKKLQKKVVTEDKNRTSGRTCPAIIERFTNWFKENGAELEGCDIREIENYGLGFITNTKIPEFSLVISVPKKLMLTVDAAKKTPLKQLIEKDDLLGNMPNITLAVFLLYEKYKSESFWKPYIDILPNTYNTVLYFTVDELLELKGSPTFEKALCINKCIIRQFAYFYKLFNTSEDSVSHIMRKRFSFEDYCWAVSSVMTRQNKVPSENGITRIDALIPLWDICNHMNGTITTDYNPDLKRCECLALKTYQPGEQFFIFYGERSNAELFLYNGFVYEENEHDIYWIQLGISKDDPLREQRTELLKMFSFELNESFFLTKDGEPINDGILKFIYIFKMNQEHLEYWLKSEGYNFSLCLNIQESWSFLQTRLKLLLGTYKTTIEEDLKLLQEEQLSPNRKLAIRMRLTEKMILKKGIDYADRMIERNAIESIEKIQI
ncbi:actin-histidine N-methyltransferase [Diorhabda carinulata]|uniref:actin-histidine N-methyltransferase n=1 Tax=Diorhabda carinulata TaxID=1163345 RepID=UPI0025A2BD3A|nr:actin-histidine N-methyltransferase [Diorhabda carinulata]